MTSIHRLSAVAAALASLGTLGSVVILFHSVSSEPWLPAEGASLVAHCEAAPAAARKACMRDAIMRENLVQVAER